MLDNITPETVKTMEDIELLHLDYRAQFQQQRLTQIRQTISNELTNRIQVYEQSLNQNQP